VLPAQYTYRGGTVSAPKTIYSDATTKQLATFTPDNIPGHDTYTILDCFNQIEYSNAPAIPGIPGGRRLLGGGAPGACALSKPSDFAGCPSIYAPTWPPSTADFYAGHRAYATFTSVVDCPAPATGKCDRYFQSYPSNAKNPKMNGAQTYEFLIGQDQVPVWGKIVINANTKSPYNPAITYIHTFKAGVDMSIFERPTDCPDPKGPCGQCLIGPCAQCKSCLKVKYGACKKCWTRDATTGKQCLKDDKSACQKCYPPPTPIRL